MLSFEILVMAAYVFIDILEYWKKVLWTTGPLFFKQVSRFQLKRTIETTAFKCQGNSLTLQKYHKYHALFFSIRL